jgi:cytochrome c553
MEALANYLEQQPFVPAEQEFAPALVARGRDIHRNQGCVSCHFQGGRNSRGVAPILAGQQTRYLRKSLLEIHAGSRSGPRVMNKAVRSLGDDEIEALLSFYASGQDGPKRSDLARSGSRPKGNG